MGKLTHNRNVVIIQQASTLRTCRSSLRPGPKLETLDGILAPVGLHSCTIHALVRLDRLVQVPTQR